MAGYSGTSNSPLAISLGLQNLVTQAALSYVSGDTIQLTFTLNSSIFMTGTVTGYNGVTGSMSVNIVAVFGNSPSLQPGWNTQVWGSIGGLLQGWTLSLLGGIPVTPPFVAPTITVRTLNANWDPVRGSGAANFLQDIQAVAQIIGTRLKLYQGEWFENVLVGLPLFQSILGVSTTSQAFELVIRQNILGAPYVSGVSDLQIQYSGATRHFAFQATVQTLFGTFTFSQ